MVICPAFGHEYVHSHRSVRHLADALARSGITVLRFDYDGTGDSAGDDRDPDRVPAWRESIRVAMQTLREATGFRIGLIGVRFGGTLAATVAAETEVACLVLWGAYTRGRQYLRELKALQFIGGGDGQTFEPGGFLIAEPTQHDIADLDVTAAAPRTAHVLKVPADPEMFAPPHAAVVPHGAIAQIVQWIGALEAVPCDVPSIAVTRREQHLGGVGESFLQHDGMFGIVSEPPRDRNGPMIVLTNAGATHHVGPNRLYVFLARALSGAGFPCLRFDLPGLGDSVIEDPAQENDAYLPAATSIIGGVIAAMPQRPVVIAGLCSGAHAAFHSALELEDAPIVESVLINPRTFYYHRGMSLDQPLTQYSQWQWYMRSMRRRDRWTKVLRGQVRFRDIARVAWRRIRESLTRQPDQLARDITRIMGSGRKLTFIFSRFDSGHDLLMANAGREVKRLRNQGLTLWRIDDANHTFEVGRSREAMIDLLVKHLSARYLR